MGTFGERFKSIRLSMGLTQNELTEDFNVKYGYAFSKTTISQYENNRRIPEMNTIKKFAEYFSVSLDYLLCNDLAVVREGANLYLNKGVGKYIELTEVTMLIKSLADSNLIRDKSNNLLSEQQKKILCNGIDVINGLVNSYENKS